MENSLEYIHKTDFDVHLNLIQCCKSTTLQLKLENKKRKESEEELSLYLDVSADLKATVNIDGYIIKANGSLKKILGWSEEEVKAMHYSNLVHHDDFNLLEYLYDSNCMTEENYKVLHNDCGAIRRMLISSLKTIKIKEGFGRRPI